MVWIDFLKWENQVWQIRNLIRFFHAFRFLIPRRWSLYLNVSASEESSKGISDGQPLLSREDVELVSEAISNSDPSSGQINDLYRKYSPSIFWVCMKYMHNHDDAEDMVHQVFLKVQQHLNGFKGQSQIYSWIYRIAVNECIQVIRKRKFESDQDTSEMDQPALMNIQDQIDAKITLDRIMASTDPQTVEILFLLYLEGLTQEEVVTTLCISRTTVNRKVTAFKARMDKFR